MSSIGAIVAAALRGDRDELDEWRGTTYLCRTCERESLTLEDGECRGCLLGHEALYEEQRPRRMEAIRQGFLHAARVLRRHGFHEEAAWHERKAGIR